MRPTSCCRRGLSAAFVALAIAASRPPPRAPRRAPPPPARRAPPAHWTPADKHGFGTATTTHEQGLAHAPGRRADRGLLPRPRHAGAARPAVRRHRRQHVRRARDRRHDPHDRARRPAQPHLPPGQHGQVRALPDHQDLRHRPGAQRAAGRRALRVAHRHGRYQLYALADPALSNDGNDDSGTTAHGALVAQDAERRRARSSPTPRFDAHLERLPRHERRLDRPARRLPAWTGATRARRTATSCRPAATKLDGRRGSGTLTLALGFGATGAGARSAAARRARPAASAAPRARYAAGWHGYLGSLKRAPALSAAAFATDLRRVGDGARRPRGQDLPRRLVASPTMPWVWGTGLDEPVRRLPPRLVARPLPDRHRAARGRRPRRRRARARLPVRPPAEARRLVPAELDRRRHAALDEPAARRGRVPDRARLAARPHATPPTWRARQARRRLPRSPTARATRRSAGRTRTATRRPRSPPRSPGLICAADIARAQRRRRASAATLRGDRRRLAAQGRGAGPRRRTARYSPTAVLPAPDQGRQPERRHDVRRSATAARPTSTSARSSTRASSSSCGSASSRADDPTIRNSLAGRRPASSASTRRTGAFWHRFNFDGYGETARRRAWDIVRRPTAGQRRVGRAVADLRRRARRVRAAGRRPRAARAQPAADGRHRQRRAT